MAVISALVLIIIVEQVIFITPVPTKEWDDIFEFVDATDPLKDLMIKESLTGNTDKRPVPGEEWSNIFESTDATDPPKDLMTKPSLTGKTNNNRPVSIEGWSDIFESTDAVSSLEDVATEQLSTGEVGNNRNGNTKIVDFPPIVGPLSCPFYHVPSVDPQQVKNMKKLWIVTRIVPKGKSTYSDKTAACSLHSFVPDECKCLRYYFKFEKDESIIFQSMSLHVGLQSYRYNENRIVFIDKKYDVFQGQYIFSAVIDANSLQVSSTKSPTEYELFPQFEPFALLGTDDYQTYAIYASCAHNTDTPLAWVAIAEQAFQTGLSKETKKAILDVFEKNKINTNSLILVDQRQCLQMTTDML